MPFVKGDPRIPAVKRKLLAAGGAEAVDQRARELGLPALDGTGEPSEALPMAAGETDQLADMRHVYTRPKSEDRTQGQRILRKWLNQDVPGFMKAKSQLEAKLLASQQEPQVPKQTDWKGAGECPTCGRWVPTEKDKDLETTLKEQIAEDEAKLAQEDAELAARPDAVPMGASRQAELKEALWCEQLVRKKVLELHGNGVTEEDPPGDLLDDFYALMRARDAELAIMPKPAAIIAALQRAVEATREREKMWQKELEEVRDRAKQTGDDGPRMANANLAPIKVR
jgi:hypothetical protein